MSLLPGWGSVEATKTIRDLCELCAIALFLMVVVAQVGSYVYGHRRDFLVEAANRAAQQRLLAALDGEDRRHAAEVAVLQRKVTDAQSEAARAAAQASREPRRLNDTEQSALVMALLPFAGQPVAFASVMGDADAERYKQDFVEIIGRAHWQFDPSVDVVQAIMQPQPVGVQVAVNQGDMDAGRPPGAVTALVQTLDALGITSGHTVYLSPDVPSGAIRLIIGVRHLVE